MMIAQITDMHIKPDGVLAYGRLDTAPYLRRAVDHLLALKPRPDVVLATGDLVDGGLPEEYRRLHALLAPLSMPVYLIPGNHDNRDALAAALTDHAYLPRGGRFMHYVVQGHPARLIALDTLHPRRVGSLLRAEGAAGRRTPVRDGRHGPHPPPPRHRVLRRAIPVRRRLEASTVNTRGLALVRQTSVVSSKPNSQPWRCQC